MGTWWLIVGASSRKYNEKINELAKRIGEDAYDDSDAIMSVSTDVEAE